MKCLSAFALAAIMLSATLVAPAHAYLQRAGSDLFGNACWRNCVVKDNMPYCGPRFCNSMKAAPVKGKKG